MLSANTLEKGDAIKIALRPNDAHTSGETRELVDARVVRAASIGGVRQELLVEYERPDGQTVQRTVPMTDVSLGDRRRRRPSVVPRASEVRRSGSAQASAAAAEGDKRPAGYAPSTPKRAASRSPHAGARSVASRAAPP